MKHLKLFDNAASYEVWKNGEDYVTPSVSYVEENDTIFYESEEEFTEDELLYYYDGTKAKGVINLTTLKVKKYQYDEQIGEGDASVDEQRNIVIDVVYPMGGNGGEVMYWTSKSVNSIPMNFEYTLYDSSSNEALKGEFNEMVTFNSNGFEPKQKINLYKSYMFDSWSILEIKSKISNKTYRIKFIQNYNI